MFYYCYINKNKRFNQILREILNNFYIDLWFLRKILREEFMNLQIYFLHISYPNEV